MTGFDNAIEEAWLVGARAFDVQVVYVTVDPVSYNADSGATAATENEYDVPAILAPVNLRMIEAGAAEAGDMICQVQMSQLGRKPKPGDRVEYDDAEWKVRTVSKAYIIAELVIGKA